MDSRPGSRMPPPPCSTPIVRRARGCGSAASISTATRRTSAGRWPARSQVFVSVPQAAPPGGDALGREARALTEAVAGACGRSAEHVHLLYEPPAAGRIAFGGELRR